MADSTVIDFSKMKVIELRKELKSRGLALTGDKSELIARLQSAVSLEHTDINLDSDEIDSDGVLEDEDDKRHSEIILDEAVNINEELVLADPSPTKEQPTGKPQRILKRKITNSFPKETKDTQDTQNSENKEAKKLVLNRAPSFTSTQTDAKPTLETETESKVKIISDIDDTSSKLELRAKRFGLPVKMTETERKEARKIRFGQGSTTTNTASSLADNYEKLKKRAERFGQSVSKIMTDLENREKLEKRKEKFKCSN